jgi:hypothetical protein
MAAKERKVVAGSGARKFLHDVEATGAQRLALFGQLKAAGELDGEDADQVGMTENALRMLASLEKDRA